ncbi:DUF6069 family protein [Rugosimonospora africana]|uniref:Uncharacterized protein n=1 Tax=Rugosimonospora africana TaxID=556532 RepID=A0A8J3QWN5_9ACTN|nr:DUF6069 family protein [Rugosimonospora africana]GIH17926.1 hypothetical protein Raf01_60980 [Rugosimonospora africana]
MSTITVPASTRPAAARGARPLAVAATVAATLAVWAVADPLAGVRLAVRSGDSTRIVGPASVAVVGLVVGLAAWGLLALLERVSRRARGIWTGIALAVFVVSLAGPLGGATTAATVSLACLHLAAAAVLIPLLARTAGRGRG